MAEIGSETEAARPALNNPLNDDESTVRLPAKQVSDLAGISVIERLVIVDLGRDDRRQS